MLPNASYRFRHFSANFRHSSSASARPRASDHPAILTLDFASISHMFHMFSIGYIPPAFRVHHVLPLRYLFPSSGYDTNSVYSLVHLPVCPLSSNINYGHPLLSLRLPLFPKLGHSAKRGRNTQVEATSYLAITSETSSFQSPALALQFRCA